MKCYIIINYLPDEKRFMNASVYVLCVCVWGGGGSVKGDAVLQMVLVNVLTTKTAQQSNWKDVHV